MGQDVVNWSAGVAIATALIFLASTTDYGILARVLTPTPAPVPAPITEDPKSDPARFAIVLLGRTNDYAASATFERGTLTLTMQFRWWAVSPEIFDVARIILARFPAVRSIEILGVGENGMLVGLTIDRSHTVRVTY
jgi:hypothetical protein